jgi:hypothetical protein
MTNDQFTCSSISTSTPLAPSLDKKRNISFLDEISEESDSMESPTQYNIKVLSVSMLNNTKADNNDNIQKLDELKKHDKEPSDNKEAPRRSKRVRLETNEIGLYEFETIKDFQGNDLIVPKLTGVKERVSLSKSLNETSERKKKPKKLVTKAQKLDKKKIPEKSKQLVKKEPLEETVVQKFETSIISYNSNLEDKLYKRVNDGVGMYMRGEEEDDGILCLQPGSFCKTQRHTCGMFYVVRRGMCSLLIDGVKTMHEIGDVMKIPKGIKYKIANCNDTSYLHFQFL